jgi:hypothetical protein
MQRRVAIQPFELQPAGDEIEVSPVRLHVAGLDGEITFRVPVGKPLNEVLSIVISMLTRSICAEEPGKPGCDEDPPREK